MPASLRPCAPRCTLRLGQAHWLTLHRLNRVKGWFRIGELIFWDAIALVLIFLVWLRWF
jgi:hypothetical protein